MRMLSTFSLISYPVGVRNLIKERQKYLFRSLLTKKNDHHTMVVFLSFGSGIEDSHHSAVRRGVRIPRPKIDKLACQAQGVGIFAKGEYP